jgi:hypothetical protein
MSLNFSLKDMSGDNPLNVFEDVLESSGYEYDRLGQSRLHFQCDGKQGSYSINLEWNDDAHIIKCLIITTDTANLPRDYLKDCAERMNESAWHGFFDIDGVGNTIFRSLIPYMHEQGEDILDKIEAGIDNALKETDRFIISLSISENAKAPDLFSNEDNADALETLALMFSETKGNA